MEKEAFINFTLKVDANKKWRIVIFSSFVNDRRLAGQFGALYEEDIPVLKDLVAEAEATVLKIGRFSKPPNVSTNTNADLAKFAVAGMMTCGISLLYAINKKQKVYPRTAITIGSVGPMTILVVSEEPRKAFVEVHVVGYRSRNAISGITLDGKGFQKMKDVVRVIEEAADKISH